MGTDMRPSRKPMAWETLSEPTSSKAMGAMIQMKQPSNSPISRQTAISPPNTLHRGIIMDMRPMTRNDDTWRDKGVTQRTPTLCYILYQTLSYITSVSNTPTSLLYNSLSYITSVSNTLLHH